MNRPWNVSTALLPRAGAVLLGRLHPGGGSDARGRLLYQDRPEQIVCPQTRIAGGWRCEVIATTDPNRQRAPVDDRHIAVGDEELALLPTVLSGRLLGLDGWALVWTARARQRFGNTPTATVARVLAEQLRPPGQLRVRLDPAVIRRLGLAASVRRGGLGRIVLRLAQANALRLSTLDTPGRLTVTLTGPGMPT
jgi:hypothetical protein